VPAHLDQFTYGWLTPVLAYLFSFLGCLLGLKATERSRTATSGGQRARWLILAAWAIGGTGIWVMHFVAMIGFDVDGTDVRYNLPITLASWLTAVIVVGIGLFIVGFGKPSIIKVIGAGILTGSGVAAMHYSGMDAMRMNGVTTYKTPLVDASIAIAIVASIVALWFTVVIKRTIAVIIAAAIMAVAVTAMHYTGMAAMRVHLTTVAKPVTGTTPLTLLVPIFGFVLTVVVALGYGMLNSPSGRDIEHLDELASRISRPGLRPADRAPQSSGFGQSAGFRVPRDSDF
jgi:NO-binding membrane sensor protein with MHYT domain